MPDDVTNCSDCGVPIRGIGGGYCDRCTVLRMPLGQLRAVIDDLTVWQLGDRESLESALDAELARVEAVVTAARAVVDTSFLEAEIFGETMKRVYVAGYDEMKAVKAALAALEES